MKKLLIAMLLVIVTVSLAASAALGVKKRKPKPYEFGAVTINNYSQAAGMNPVVFDHWSHRNQFTCRLCHVDIGFGMRVNETKVKAADNISGYFCGVCHNGKRQINGKVVFEACSKQFGKEDVKRCERCHNTGKNPQKEQNFRKFAANMPRERFGNEINWEKAEEQGLIKLIDFIEGVSIAKPPLADMKEFMIGSKTEGVQDIIFSHKKHTKWNGCEVCHPDIFIGVKKGTDKYTMVELFEGKYCGACHDFVAFPQIDCQRCHTNNVAK
jgi:c(7)-type cytochrome triheme protein